MEPIAAPPPPPLPRSQRRQAVRRTAKRKVWFVVNLVIGIFGVLIALSALNSTVQASDGSLCGSVAHPSGTSGNYPVPGCSQAISSHRVALVVWAIIGVALIANAIRLYLKNKEEAA